MLRPRRDPFSLMAFHRVFIIVAIVGCVGYGVRAMVRADEGSSPIEAAVAWGIAGLLAVYFWNNRHRR